MISKTFDEMGNSGKDIRFHTYDSVSQKMDGYTCLGDIPSYETFSNLTIDGPEGWIDLDTIDMMKKIEPDYLPPVPDAFTAHLCCCPLLCRPARASLPATRQKEFLKSVLNPVFYLRNMRLSLPDNPGCPSRENRLSMTP
ncbi:MAG: hypothetical protein KDI13_00070 [Alphaproteobacteria bacterium]|nr:hypothetical protein [Alphaproteobacteria bacterium]